MGEGGDCTRARLLLLHSARVQECKSAGVKERPGTSAHARYLRSTFIHKHRTSVPVLPHTFRFSLLLLLLLPLLLHLLLPFILHTSYYYYYRYYCAGCAFIFSLLDISMPYRRPWHPRRLPMSSKRKMYVSSVAIFSSSCSIPDGSCVLCTLLNEARGWIVLNSKQKKKGKQ